jgi:glutaminase
MSASATFTDILEEVAVSVRPQFGKGRVADYIPALAEVSPAKFGMAVATVDGAEHVTGDADEAFSAQSITKVFALGLALNRFGDEVWSRVGKEPSGAPFNFLSQLEIEHGIPRNPFINPGALVVTDLLMRGSSDPARLVRDLAAFLAGDDTPRLDEAVARSELEAAHRNLAIANLLRSFGALDHDPQKVVEAYCRQCSLTLSCRQLARAFLPLAAEGFSRVAEETIYPARLARRINALMLTSGLYDAVGSFAYRVGLPAKSGVGGGIAAVAPGKFAVAVWSPELDRFGNSMVGAAALEVFANLTQCSIL